MVRGRNSRKGPNGGPFRGCGRPCNAVGRFQVEVGMIVAGLTVQDLGRRDQFISFRVGTAICETGSRLWYGWPDAELFGGRRALLRFAVTSSRSTGFIR